MKDKKDILKIIAEYKPATLTATNVSAAVMIILLDDKNNNFKIVLTKRSSNLPTYPGHYSFPGGIRDPHDLDLYETAKRETQEELNLPTNSYQYLGQLDDFISRDGNLVRPFVTLMEKSDFEKLHKISPLEIDELYELDLNKLEKLRDEPLLHQITLRRPSYAFSEANVFVWGLTAAILVHLNNIITGENRSLGKKITK